MESYNCNSTAMNKINGYFGLLSYPIFISHVLAIDITLAWVPSNTVYRYYAVYTIVFMICPILIKLQAQVDKAKYKIRGFGLQESCGCTGDLVVMYTS